MEKKDQKKKKWFVLYGGKESAEGQRRKESWKMKGKWKKIMRDLQMKIKCNKVSDCKNRWTEV